MRHTNPKRERGLLVRIELLDSLIKVIGAAAPPLTRRRNSSSRGSACELSGSLLAAGSCCQAECGKDARAEDQHEADRRWLEVLVCDAVDRNCDPGKC